MKTTSRLSKTGKGLTIVEILIAAGLTLLLLSLLISFLIPVMRASVTGSVRTEIQQEAVRALDSMAYDLKLSSSGGLSLSCSGESPEKGPVYLGIIRIEDVSNEGKQLWEESVIVYCWEGQQKPLVRKVWKPGSPPSISIAPNRNLPQRVPAPDLSLIAREASLGGQVVARDVTELSIYSPSAQPVVSSPVTVILNVERKDATGKTEGEKIRFRRIIDLRNQI